jgi:hypothetical protein
MFFTQKFLDRNRNRAQQDPENEWPPGSGTLNYRSADPEELFKDPEYRLAATITQIRDWDW